MSIITLTDRISVSVRAKNDTEKSAQNKATGANIQKALGGSGLSDADLEEIGNVDSITDEDGNEWIKMEDVIAAGRKMKERGAFDKKNYRYGNVACVPVLSLSAYPINKDSPDDGWVGLYAAHTPGRLFGNYTYIQHTANDNIVTKNVLIGAVRNINNNKITLLTSGNIPFNWLSETYPPTGSLTNDGSYYGTSNWSLNSGDSVNPEIPITDVGSTFNSLSPYGDLHEETSPSSLIDWDAPNAEVERQIKNLHDTWDVSDHPGAVTGNGTYVLAGPIEFNDGD